MWTMPVSAMEPKPGNYEICIKESISDRWLEWFGEFNIAQNPSGETLLTGPIADQSALHGLLAKIRDLNLTLISVNRIERSETNKKEDKV
jgi:hypothetical protein